MEKKPRSSFLRLLSEPAFDFTPYFEKAVIEWLERNMDGFLEQAPEASKYFISDYDKADIVARHIPIAENDENVLKFIRNMTTDYHWVYALNTLMPRLVNAGKADFVLECVPLLTHMTTDVRPAIKALSNESIRILFDKMDLNKCGWTSDCKSAFIERLPSDLLIKVDPSKWEGYHNTLEKAKAVSAMAAKWPVETIAEFLQKYGTTYTPLTCMGCTKEDQLRHMRSKPGYTLHRKVCDPNNEHPNIWTTVANRIHRTTHG